MKNSIKRILFLVTVSIGVYACSDDDDTTDTTEETTTELHAAFAVFNTTATDIYLSSNGASVTIETTGLPNHETVGSSLYNVFPDPQ